MKVLYSWLREFVPELMLEPEALGDLFSEIGLECDEVISIGARFDGMVVARVSSLAPHPDADRIQVVMVDDGSGEPQQICCGAFNMAVGDLVPLASVGATMPNGMEIARRKLRGEWSNGMLCSAEEIGLPPAEDGIMILDEAAEPGTALAEALDLEREVVFDLDLTPNRPDALSIVGVARDVAAKLGLDLVIPGIDIARVGDDVSTMASVRIDDEDLCGRFSVWALSGVTPAVSPGWLQRRLTLCGMRPINAIVDASNYVMLEYGHPNHTYDLAKVEGGVLAVRRAEDGESIVTLDDAERILEPGDGVIVDASRSPVGIAGVMGGASTEISDSTTDVLLEMAWWDPDSIGGTSKRLGLRSEASIRFEKGVDPDVSTQAALRFAELLAPHGATLHPGVVTAEGRLPDPAVVSMSASRVNGLLGCDMDVTEMIGYLEPLGFVCTHSTGEDFDVAVPGYRPDSSLDVDIIEEIARMHGYENFGKRVPASPLAGGLTPRQRDVRRVRERLVGERLAEAAPMPFLAPGDLEACGVRNDAVSVTNPLVTEESVMRTSLLPGLLKTLGYNASHRRFGIGLFEIGRCFAANPDGGVPLEWEELAVIIGGSEAPEAVGVVLRLARSLGVSNVVVRNEAVGGLHPGRSARVLASGTAIGSVGEVDPGVAAAFGVVERVAFASLTLGGAASWHGGYGLLSAARSDELLAPVSRFPSADLDLAFVVPEAVHADEVARTLQETGGAVVVSVELFDVYRGKNLPAGSRSLAYRMRLQSDDRTLADEELAEIQSRLISAVEAAHDSALRS